MTMYNCVTQYSTEKFSSDNLPTYPRDNHHRSDDVYWTAGKAYDNDNDVYFTLATSDSRIGKYKTENN